MAKTNETSNVKKAASKTRTSRAKTATTRASGRNKAAKNATPPIAITSEEHWRKIAAAAYHKAEQRGFTPEGSLNDWLAAEQETDALLGGK
jgi:hypothetical protein